MGREVRKVPANWQHPKKENGDYQPMNNYSYEETFNEWLEERNEFKEQNNGWKDKDGNAFEDLYGKAPVSRYYMPDWNEEEKTHFMMYENISEGTPISPAFATEEELARWLADNKANAGYYSNATYEQWLSAIKRGYVPSFVVNSGKLMSGVEFASE